MAGSVGFTTRVTLAAVPARVFAALTDAAELTAWFAEHADVRLDEGRYEFWGRHTPEGERARQRLLDTEHNRLLRFGWHLGGAERTVAVALAPRGSGTVVTITETDAAGEVLGGSNFWHLAAHHLADHVEGRELAPRHDHTGTTPGLVRLRTPIGAPPERVFAALVEPAQLDRWIPGTATVDARVGGRYDFGWGGHGPGTILELEPGRLLAHTWHDPDEPDTTVRWELAGSDRTLVDLTHRGWTEQRGWREALAQLKRLLEVGPEADPVESR